MPIFVLHSVELMYCSVFSCDSLMVEGLADVTIIGCVGETKVSLLLVPWLVVVFDIYI